METNITHQNIGDEAHALFQSIKQLVDQARQTVVVSINTALCRLNYAIGQYLVQALGFRPYDSYGQSIIAILSQRLTKEYDQMELYLKYLQRYELQPHEQAPIGLLLCSEGNTEHIEQMSQF